MFMRPSRFWLTSLLIGISFVCGISSKRGWGVPEINRVPFFLFKTSSIRDRVFTIRAGSPAGESLYVGTRKGLYQSEDGGRSWRVVFRSIQEGGSVQAIALSPTDGKSLYIGAGSSLWVSPDGGIHWHRLLKMENPITCVAIDPHEGRHLFIGSEGGLSQSTDGGTTGFRVSAQLASEPIHAVLCQATSPGFWYALSDSGLFRSEDHGTTWERVWISFHSTAEDMASTETRSEEDRASSGMLSGLAWDSLHHILYLGTTKGLFMSPDDGRQWLGFPTAGLGTPEIMDILPDVTSGSLYVATRHGLFSYAQEEKRWRLLREGTVHTIAFTHDGRGLFVGTETELLKIAVPKEELERSLHQKVSHGFPPGPSIQQVQQAAIRYAEVMPEKIQGWRRGAVWRNWVPKFTLNMDQNRNRTIASSTSSGKTTFSVGPEDESLRVGFAFTWDLANFVWNPEQTSIDHRSRLMVQLRQNILEEATRLYFERKRIMAEFLGNPTEDLLLQSERHLRVEELNAQLDALTGGWFSQNSSESNPL